MKLWHYVIIFFVLIIVALIIFSILEARKASVNLSPEEFKNKMRKGQLIDVRNKKEYDEGHINGARNIPLAMIMRNHQNLRSDLPIYLYDDTGRKSKRAAIYLQTRNFTEIYQLEQGLKNWPDALKRKK